MGLRECKQEEKDERKRRKGGKDLEDGTGRKGETGNLREGEVSGKDERKT